MYQQFSLETENRDNIEIMRISGYLEDQGGSTLKQHVQKCLDSGITLYAIDFSKTELISSPGVAALLDIGGVVIDDFAGNIAVWGIDKHHTAVLEMSGFFFLVNQVADEAEAMTWLSAS